jgi:hypothetical protein
LRHCACNCPAWCRSSTTAARSYLRKLKLPLCRTQSRPIGCWPLGLRAELPCSLPASRGPFRVRFWKVHIPRLTKLRLARSARGGIRPTQTRAGARGPLLAEAIPSHRPSDSGSPDRPRAVPVTRSLQTGPSGPAGNARPRGSVGASAGRRAVPVAAAAALALAPGPGSGRGCDSGT